MTSCYLDVLTRVDNCPFIKHFLLVLKTHWKAHWDINLPLVWHIFQRTGKVEVFALMRADRGWMCETE